MSGLEKVLSRYHRDVLRFFREHPEFTTREYYEFLRDRWDYSYSSTLNHLKRDVEVGILEKVGWGRYRVKPEVLVLLGE